MTVDKTSRLTRLSRFLIIPGIILTLALSLVFIGSISIFSYQKLSQDFDQQFQNVGTLFTESITNSFLLGEDEVVYRSCKLLLDQPSVLGIRVQRANGDTICSVGEIRRSGTWVKSIERVILFNPNSETVAGNVLVSFSLDNLRVETFWWIGFGLILTLLFVVANVVLYRHLSKVVATPLAQICSSLEDGNTGAFPQRLLSLRSQIAEILFLKTAIEKMSSTVEDYQTQLLKTERDRVVGELARKIAHDIRSPVSALKLLAPKLSRQDSPEMKLIGMAIERIENMATDMLSESKNVSAPQPISNLANVITSIVLEMVPRGEVKGVALQTLIDEKVSVNGEKFFVSFGKFELARAIGNLIQNSIDASKPGGEVVVRLSYSTSLEISVEDRGCGMPNDLVKDILEKGRAQTTKWDGNGIGLTSAIAILRGMGGLVTIQSSEGNGTRVVTKLPVLKGSSFKGDLPEAVQ